MYGQKDKEDVSFEEGQSPDARLARYGQTCWIWRAEPQSRRVGRAQIPLRLIAYQMPLGFQQITNECLYDLDGTQGSCFCVFANKQDKKGQKMYGQKDKEDLSFEEGQSPDARLARYGQTCWIWRAEPQSRRAGRAQIPLRLSASVRQIVLTYHAMR